MKKIIAGLTTVAIAATLAACGGNSTNNAAAADETALNDVAINETASEVAFDNATRLGDGPGGGNDAASANDTAVNSTVGGSDPAGGNAF